MLPHTRVGLIDKTVETVDEEPTVLTVADAHELQISNLAPSGGNGGAFYEIAIAGVGFGGECTTTCVYSAKFMVVPVAAVPAAGVDEAFLSVTALGASSGVKLLSTLVKPDAEAVIVPGNALRLTLLKATESREVVVDVRRAGRPCSDAVVELV